jgi:uncharacterized protein (DUF362 family)
MDRREFLRKTACGAGVIASGGLIGCQREGAGTAGGPPPTGPVTPSARTPETDAGAGVAAADGRVGKNRVFDEPPADVHAAIATDDNAGELVGAALEAYGGVGAVINRGDIVVIKPNLAWGRTPDAGANTSPEVLKAVIQIARNAGAEEILVLEHSCDSSSVSFEMSGAKDVCAEMGVSLVSTDNEAMYQEQPVTRGVNIRREMIATEILECDVYINVPTLKHHGATNMTLCMKNQMGAIWDPQRYHREKSAASKAPNLHQNITDLAGALRPTINIVDATRGLTTNGPKGPGVVKDTSTVIVSHDIVCADMLGAKLLGYTAKDVPYIELAADLGLGALDLDSVEIARV